MFDQNEPEENDLVKDLELFFGSDESQHKTEPKKTRRKRKRDWLDEWQECINDCLRVGMSWDEAEEYCAQFPYN